MAQTAAQRKAAEEKAAKQEQEVADAAAPAQEEDEFASTPASNDDTGISDAEKLAEAEAAALKASQRLNTVFHQLGSALGLEKDENGTITANEDELLAAAVEKLAAPEPETQAASTNESGPQAAAIRLTVEEVDGAGKALRRFSSLVPMAQANPVSVGSTVQRTVEQIISIPLDAAPALQQEPVED